MAENKKISQGEANSQDKFYDLISLCNTDKPAEEDIQALRKYLTDEPAIGRKFGCLTQSVIDKRLEQVVKNGVNRELIRSKMDDVARQLNYTESSELEKMLIKHILLCWLDLYAVQSRAANLDNESHSLNVGLYWDKRVNSAQRRFLKATESLAKLRKTTKQVELRENRQESAGKTKTKRSVRITEEK